MMPNMYSFLTLSLVIPISEACIFPPPPSPSPTTTKAPSALLSIINSTGRTVSDFGIVWENSGPDCPSLLFNEIPPLQHLKLLYLLKCGKMKKVSGKVDGEECTPLQNVEPADIYIKFKSIGSTQKCVITN